MSVQVFAVTRQPIMGRVVGVRGGWDQRRDSILAHTMMMRRESEESAGGGNRGRRGGAGRDGAAIANTNTDRNNNDGLGGILHGRGEENSQKARNHIRE